MRVDNLSKLGRLFWSHVDALPIINITLLDNIIHITSLLFYPYPNLHSLARMGNGDCSVFVAPEIAEWLGLVVRKGE